MQRLTHLLWLSLCMDQDWLWMAKIFSYHSLINCYDGKLKIYRIFSHPCPILTKVQLLLILEFVVEPWKIKNLFSNFPKGNTQFAIYNMNMLK